MLEIERLHVMEYLYMDAITGTNILGKHGDLIHTANLIHDGDSCILAVEMGLKYSDALFLLPLS